MSKNQQPKPIDEGVDPSNEKIVLDQIKVPAEEKKQPSGEKGSQDSTSKK